MANPVNRGEIYENNHKIFTIFRINPLNFFLSTLAKHTLFSPNYPSLQTKRNLVRQAQVLVRQAPVAPCLVRQAPVAPCLVRQAACRTKLRATGYLLLPQYLFVFASAFVFVRLFLFVCNIFFYLRSNLIRQPKQQNKISFLILQNPISEFKFPGIFH